MLREVRSLFTRTNILARKFKMCSVAVKTVLFKSFCVCFYGIELWKFYTAGAINRLRSCYIRCMKSFLGYTRRYSVTSMLLELRLPTFDTLLWNSRVRLHNQLQACNNALISQLQLLWCDFTFTTWLLGVTLCFMFRVLWFMCEFVCACVCLCVCVFSMSWVLCLK